MIHTVKLRYNYKIKHMLPLFAVNIKVKTNLGSSKIFNFYQFVNIDLLTNFDTIICRKENISNRDNIF